MTMNITTNNHRRELVSFAELPESARSDFDYVAEDDYYSPRFVQYRGSWHDVSDVQAITVAPSHTPFGYNVEADNPLAKWHGIATDSFFSAVVFRYVEDSYSDFVVVGTALA
jgi:hypothetical protein